MVRGVSGGITPRTILRRVSAFCGEISLTAGNPEQRKQATKGPCGGVSITGRTGHYRTIAAATLWCDHRAFLRGMLTTFARVARVGGAIVVVVAIERFGCAARTRFATVIDGALVVIVACCAIGSCWIRTRTRCGITRTCDVALIRGCTYDRIRARARPRNARVFLRTGVGIVASCSIR